MATETAGSVATTPAAKAAKVGEQLVELSHQAGEVAQKAQRAGRPDEQAKAEARSAAFLEAAQHVVQLSRSL